MQIKYKKILMLLFFLFFCLFYKAHLVYSQYPDSYDSTDAQSYFDENVGNMQHVDSTPVPDTLADGSPNPLAGYTLETYYDPTTGVTWVDLEPPPLGGTGDPPPVPTGDGDSTPPDGGDDGPIDGDGDGDGDGDSCNPSVCVTGCGGASCGQMGTCTNECGGQNSCWMGSCALTAPTCTCGAFDTTTATTPVTFTWSTGATNLQVWDSEGSWWYNNTASSGITVSSKDNLGVLPGIPPNRTVIARNSLAGQYSQQCSVQCPMPTPYPTAVITGALRQKSGSACYLTDVSNPINNPTFSGLAIPGDCITPTCSALPDSTNATGYRCIVTFDNVGCVGLNKQPPTSTNLTINMSAQGYESGQFSDASCNLSGSVVAVGTGTGTVGKDVAFPFTSTKWIKLKNTSFINKTVSSISVPALATAYDVDDTGEKLFIIGNAGSALGISVNPDPPGTQYSTTNWKNNLYPASTIMTPSAYLSYVQSRKQTTNINSLSDIVADGIYVWDSADNPPSLTTVSYNFVLIAAGKTVTIDTPTFNTSSTKAIAVIADTISFTDAVTEASGIFIANTITTGTTTNQGLKINGNLIAQTTFTNDREWSDTSKPSIFMVFKPDFYLTLLPYLSISKYNWKQTQ